MRLVAPVTRGYFFLSALRVSLTRLHRERSLHDCYMKLTSFTPPLYKVGEHNTKIFLFFF